MEKNKQMKLKSKCSFCKRKSKKVPTLIAVKKAAICSDCIISATQELFRQLELERGKNK